MDNTQNDGVQNPMGDNAEAQAAPAEETKKPEEGAEGAAPAEGEATA